MKVGLIFGTRPEGIKMAPVYHKLKEGGMDVKVLVTGQHKEMLDQVLELFEIKVDYDLKIMKEGQGLSELTSRLIAKMEPILKKEKFDYILVQGDTTSGLVGALVGFYNKVPIGHIEAGLRTGNNFSPFPEEVNRKLIGNIVNIHFAATETNKMNLLKENISKEKILVTGNTVIDALLWIKKYKKTDLKNIKEKYNLLNKKYIMMTMHRRENWGAPMRNVLKAVKKYLLENKNIYLVLPMHPNPTVQKTIYEELNNVENKILLGPLEYLDFIALMDGAHFMMTDSGGVQEEAPSLGKPTLVLRDTTERPEAVEAGTAKLVGTDTENVYRYMKLLEGTLYSKMSKITNPYGNGKTSDQILDFLKKEEINSENISNFKLL